MWTGHHLPPCLHFSPLLPHILCSNTLSFSQSPPNALGLLASSSGHIPFSVLDGIFSRSPSGKWLFVLKFLLNDLNEGFIREAFLDPGLRAPPTCSCGARCFSYHYHICLDIMKADIWLSCQSSLFWSIPSLQCAIATQEMIVEWVNGLRKFMKECLSNIFTLSLYLVVSWNNTEFL